LSLFLLPIATVGISGGQPAAAPVIREFHAVRIPAPGPLGVRATTAATPWTARNWSGYAIASGKFTSVTGSWVVPTVNAPLTKRSNQYSATWAGIDGFNDGTLIQAGTEQDWRGGAAFYQSWWEILPAPETPISSITVHPGDVMSVSISKGPQWTITVTDTTTAQSFTIKRTYHGALSSAEWIQEAPTVGVRVAALADDSTFAFDQLTANGANPGLTSSEAGVMAKNHGRIVISSPSLPNPNQNGFAVAFGSVAPPPPTI